MKATHTTIFGKQVELICVEGCMATVAFKSIVGVSYEEVHISNLFEIK